MSFSRRTNTRDGWTSQQVQLRAGRMLLLVLREPAVLPVWDAAERASAALQWSVQARGGARAFLRSTVPGALPRAPLAPRQPPPHSGLRAARARALRRPRATDPLDSAHASSECAQLEVIVLR